MISLKIAKDIESAGIKIIGTSTDAIDLAEVDADITLDYELLPVAEHYLGDGHGVRAGGVAGADCNVHRRLH